MKRVVSVIPYRELRNYSLLMMDFLLAGGFKGHKHDKLNILKVVISSDPTDTNDLRQIRDLVGETFCRNDPSPLFSTLTIFGIDSLTTDRGSCRNRNAFIGARRIRRTRNFNFPFYFCFLQYPPLFDTLELILGALHPSLRITTTFSFLSSP